MSPSSNDYAMVGAIAKGRSAELRVGITSYNGRHYLDIRTYLTGEGYTGPTKKGLALQLPTAEALADVLREFAGTLSSDNDGEIARIRKSASSEVVVSMVKEQGNPPQLDAREYIETDTYEGPTKKGFRIGLDGCAELVEILETALRTLRGHAREQRTLFRPQGEEAVDDDQSTIPSTQVRSDVLGADLVQKVLPEGVPVFPDDFLDGIDLSDGRHILLPSEPLFERPGMGGRPELGTHAGFSLALKNQVEVRYVLYAANSGTRDLFLPPKPMDVFRAVVRYERKLRDTYDSLRKLFYQRTHSERAAESLTQRAFRGLGMPLPPVADH